MFSLFLAVPFSHSFFPLFDLVFKLLLLLLFWWMLATIIYVSFFSSERNSYKSVINIQCTECNAHTSCVHIKPLTLLIITTFIRNYHDHLSVTFFWMDAKWLLTRNLSHFHFRLLVRSIHSLDLLPSHPWWGCERGGDMPFSGVCVCVCDTDRIFCHQVFSMSWPFDFNAI